MKTYVNVHIFFESKGVTGRVLPEFAGDVDRWFRDPAGQILKDNSGRTVWRLPNGLYVKRFKYPGVLQRVRRRLLERARHEFDVLRGLRERGIACPLAVAHAQDRESGWLVTQEVPETHVLKSLLAGGALSPGELRSILTALGGYVRSLHDAGLRHDDLHAGNLLIRRGVAPAIFVLDAHRARLAGKVSRERRHRDVAFLLLSVYPFVTLTAAWRLVRAYGFERKETPDILGAFLKIRTRHWRGREGRCTEDCTEYACGPGAQYRRRSLEDSALTALLEDSRRVLVKETTGRRIYRVGDRFLKFMPRRTALQTWKNAHALRLRDIPSARHDACGLGKTCWVAGEWLEAEPLPEALRGDRRELLFRLARLVRRMHARGVFHQDLKASNILVRDGSLFVIDLERVKFPRLVSREQRILNLAQLNAAVGAPVTRADRLRFLRVYFGRDFGEWAHRKEWARRVMKVTVARHHVWP